MSFKDIVFQVRPILWFVAVSVILAAILQLFVQDFLYIRPVVFEQPWRLITAHWVHVGWVHYFLNMGALVCLPFIFPKFCVHWAIISSVIFSIFISVSFYFYYPFLQSYAGFSGVLHGLYLLAALLGLHDAKERSFAFIFSIGIILKLFWEAKITQGGLTEQLIGSPVFIQAHQLGVLCAIGLYLLIRTIQYIKNN